jgi:ABC-type multidrug transport system ATPase subunit/pSer/pThr/pTyr-binding forkhead associated (FHA) protein
MRFRLVHLSGSLAGRVRELDTGFAVLGRDPDAAVVFGASDATVSPRHASIKEEDGVLVLRDLDSAAGTFLDGHDIEEAELGPGDVFELGRGGPRVRIEIGETGTLVVPAPAARPTLETQTSVRRPVPRPGPDSRLRLTFLSGTREGASLELGGGVIRIGRSPGAAVWTPDDLMVSSQHAKVVRLEEAYVVIDLESTNGTWINGRRTSRAPLAEGDVLQLGTGGPELRVQVLSAEHAAGRLAATVVIPHFADLARRTGHGVLLREVALRGPVLTVGRAPDVDLVLDSPIVSRRHARFAVVDGGLDVVDLDSSNGVYVAGRRVDRARLLSGERAVVGPFELLAVAPASAGQPWRIHVIDTRNRVRVDAVGLSASAGGRRILADVSLSLPAGSFTAIIGPSGAGKSTLLSALNGARPADDGRVLLNGADLYRDFERLKSVLGHVPQEDIVHRELTVAQSLGYTARLRLPQDTTAEERAKRVADVLATLELTDHARTPIHRLSGGQRKRVSIAAELLTEPNVLFLDEPTSGLDPGLEESLMLLLRELSYKGKTIVLVTHTLDHIHLCDAVVLLADGRLAFFGPAAEARAHFAIEQMPALYGRLKETPPEQWEAEFAKTDGYRVRIREPLAAVSSEAPPAALSQAAAGPAGAGTLRQLRVLTGRYFATLLRDGRNLGLLVAQAPLVAGLIGLSLLYGPADVSYSKPKNTILFLLALVAVWFGCSNAVRELVKERTLFARERMVNLRVLPYVFSTVLVLGALAAVQCVLFYAILDGWFGIPGRPWLLLLGMWLAALTGIVLGLAVSALVGTADRAMTLLPILLIPQVLFTSPAVQMDMEGPAGLVARAMPSWWAYDLLRRGALEPFDRMDDDSVEARLVAREPTLLTRARLERMLQDGYPLLQYRAAMEITWVASLPDRLAAALPERWDRWRPAVVDAAVLAAFAAALLGLTVALQRRVR